MKLTHRLPLLLALALGLGLAAAARAADTVTPLGVQQLLREGEAKVGQQVVFEGFVTGVCHSGGKKAFFHDSNPEVNANIRVERTGNLRAFDQELVGQTLRVTGIVRELRIDAAYLDAWETRVKASQAAHEKKEDCGHDCESSLSTQAAFKRIAAYRAKIAQTPRGYLSSLWVDGVNWEVQTPQK